jgi:hypothetical protein
MAASAAVAYLLLSAGAAHADDKPVLPGLEQVAGHPPAGVSPGRTPSLHRVMSDSVTSDNNVTSHNSVTSDSVTSGLRRSAGSRRTGPAVHPAGAQKSGATGGRPAVKTQRPAVKTRVSGPADLVRSVVSPADRAGRRSRSPSGRPGATPVSRTVEQVRASAAGKRTGRLSITKRVQPPGAGKAMRTLPAPATHRSGAALKGARLRGTAPVATTIRRVTAPVKTTPRSAVARPTATLHTVTTSLTADVGPITTSITADVRPVATSLTGTLQPVTAPVTAALQPVTAALQPVTAPVTAALQPITAPVTAALQPITAPVTAALQPITTPVTAAMQPITTPVTVALRPITTPVGTAGRPFEPARRIAAAPPCPVVSAARARPVASPPPVAGTPVQVATVAAARLSERPPGTAPPTASAAGWNHDTTRLPRAHDEKATAEHGAAPGTLRPALPDEPNPDPGYLTILSSSITAGADAGPGNWATAPAAGGPPPLRTGTVTIGSTHGQGRHLSRTPPPG